MANNNKTKQVNISAKTGQYVKASFAAAHPNTTVKLTVPKGKKK